MMTSLERWLEALKPPILVVGNGQQSRGEEAERDTVSVVRFNNFRLCADAGYKVTHWVTGAHAEIRDRRLEYALVPWKRGPVPYFDPEFPSRTRAQVLHLSSNRHIRKWFPVAELKQENWPTTGFCFLAWLWSKDIYPIIRGFDGLQSGHYWDVQRDLQHIRTRQKEFEIIQQMNPARV